MKQIGVGLYTYLGDWDETFPPNRFPKNPNTVMPDTGGSGYEGSAWNWKRSLQTYVKGKGVYQCPSNDNAWTNKDNTNGCNGDESNCVPPWKGLDQYQIPNSYAINGAVFHEQYGARSLGDLKEPANLIFILESASGYPDLGDWACGSIFQHQGRRSNWLFCDTHAKNMGLGQTLKPTLLWRNPGEPSQCSPPKNMLM